MMVVIREPFVATLFRFSQHFEQATDQPTFEAEKVWREN